MFDLASAVAKAMSEVPVGSMPDAFPSTPLLDATVGLRNLLSPTPATAIVRSLPDAVSQAVGLLPASTPLGSVLGASLGGLERGTGPLPGALGVAANNLFGVPWVPSSDRFPSVSFTIKAYGPFAQSVERLGRGIMSSVFALSPRFLDQIRVGFEEASGMEEGRFRAHILTLLRELQSRMIRAAAQTVPGAPAVTPVTAPDLRALATPVKPFVAPPPGLYPTGSSPQIVYPVSSSPPPVVVPELRPTARVVAHPAPELSAVTAKPSVTTAVGPILRAGVATATPAEVVAAATPEPYSPFLKPAAATAVVPVVTPVASTPVSAAKAASSVYSDLYARKAATPVVATATPAQVVAAATPQPRESWMD